MIHSTSTNFGTNAINLKCHNSAEIIVLQGKFSVNPTNTDYIAATELQISFDTDFVFPNSESSSCYILASGDNAYTGIILEAHIEDNKLIIEKLPIFTDRTEAQIFLCSAFIPKDAPDTQTILQASTHTPIEYLSQDYRYNFHLAQGFNHIDTNWGFISALFDSLSYPRGEETILTLNGLPSDIELEIPIFCPYLTSFNETGTQANTIQIANSELKLSAIPGSGTLYLSNAFFQGYFVRNDDEE